MLNKVFHTRSIALSALLIALGSMNMQARGMEDEQDEQERKGKCPRYEVRSSNTELKKEIDTHLSYLKYRDSKYAQKLGLVYLPTTDKYEVAIEISKSFKGPHWIKLEEHFTYENAMKICEAEQFRLPLLPIWGIEIKNFFVGEDWESLILAELHHIAGDMMHIAKMQKDEDYRRKIRSAVKNSFINNWLEQKVPSWYSARMILEVKIPERREDTMKDAEYINSMCEPFMEMLGIFKRWNELQATKMTGMDLSAFHRQIRETYWRYDDSTLNFDGPDVTESPLKYRKQRKLSLFGSHNKLSVYAVDARYEEYDRSWQKIIQGAANSLYRFI